MPVYNLFSKRQQALTAEPSDILIYDVLPQQLRVQIIHILKDAYGDSHDRYSETPFMRIHNVLCREYGIFELNKRHSYKEKVLEFILQELTIDRVIDAIEVTVKYLDQVIRKDWEYKQSVIILIKEDEAIDELNERFKEHAIGYQYEGGEIIKVDSTYIHSEIVKPTLKLLYNKKFSGANEEYLNAHEHYRHGRNKECLTDCLKAFESTMKIICKKNGWVFDEKDTAKTLINICFTNHLVPAYLQSEFSSLRSLLESGIPTLRNRVGGHGQGAVQTVVQDETARFALNLTGSNLIYLVELSAIK